MKNKKWNEEKEKVFSRVLWMAKNKVPYFQPTICPAPKDIKTGQIESIKQAIKYYHRNGIFNLVVQKKYMGSYCLMCLNRYHEESYFLSRNAYEIRENRVSDIYEAASEIQEKIFRSNKYAKARWVFVEAELMPWATLGKDLIEKEFINYGKVHEDYANYLYYSSVIDKINKLKEEAPWKDSYEKQHEKRQYESLRSIEFRDLEEYKRSIDIYKKQVEIYGKEGPTQFKPFNILKVVYLDNSEKLHNLRDICEDQLEINWNTLGKVRKTNEYLNKLGKETEGIVIKPRKQRCKNVAPALKIRNNDYLQLIYGVDFQSNFEHYLSKRKIDRKLKQSIKGYNLSVDLLKIPYTKLNRKNKHYIDLLFKVLNCERYNKNLDTRL